MAMRHSSGWSTLISISFFMRAIFLTAGWFGRAGRGLVRRGLVGERVGRAHPTNPGDRTGGAGRARVVAGGTDRGESTNWENAAPHRRGRERRPRPGGP